MEPSRATVGEYLADWLLSIEMELRPRTLVSYKMNVEVHIVPRLGHFGLQALSPMHIKSFYGDLLADGRRDSSGGLSRSNDWMLESRHSKDVSSSCGP